MSESLFTPSTRQSLLALVRLLTDVRTRAEERARVTHERFNVFTTLLSAHDEVRLHTRFLHCLLDPQGTHDCGGLFLDLFFATLAEHPPLDHGGMNAVVWEPVPTPDIWTVQKEASVQEGQIDLLLECGGCGIAIENKIWAGEQADQLSRYTQYLRRRHGQRGRLIYLTLDGKEAGSHGDAPYLRISYSDHILAWLEKCLQASYAFIPINQVLLQYREVVRQLIGQTLNAALMETIADFILQHPEIIRYQPQIAAGINQAKVVFMDRLAKGIQQGVPIGYQVRLRPDMGQTSFGNHANGALIVTPPSASPLHGAPFEIWVEHISKFQALVVGIECKAGKAEIEEVERRLLGDMNRLLEAHATETRYHKADPHLLGDGTEWPTGWHDLLFEMYGSRLASLLERPLDDVVRELWAGIQTHVELLERVYEQSATGAEGKVYDCKTPPEA
jgi:hypothetical protein